MFVAQHNREVVARTVKHPQPTNHSKGFTPHCVNFRHSHWPSVHKTSETPIHTHIGLCVVNPISPSTIVLILYQSISFSHDSPSTSHLSNHCFLDLRSSMTDGSCGDTRQHGNSDAFALRASVRNHHDVIMASQLSEQTRLPLIPEVARGNSLLSRGPFSRCCPLGIGSLITLNSVYSATIVLSARLL